jgi:predicted amidohydrolase
MPVRAAAAAAVVPIEVMEESDRLTVGAVQMCSRDDLQQNLATVTALTGEAAGRGAQLVVLPECFAFLGRTERDKMAVAEVLDEKRPGRILDTLQGLATRHGVHIVGGGLPEIVPDDDRRTYNTAVVVTPTGAIGGIYRKVHLFDVDIPGGATLRESDATAPGEAPVVVSVGPAKVGVTICYDVRFPELYRELALDAGAEVFLVPAAFTAHTGRAHWHLLMRARAIENQSWVVAAAQWGQHNERRESFGHTLVVDPWGTIVGELPSGDGVVVQTLEGRDLLKTRRQMPCLGHAARWRTRRAAT